MLAATLILATSLGAPTIAPDAKPTIDRLFSHYNGLPGASVTMTMKLPFPGAPDQATKYTAVKPNKFTMSTDLTMMGAGELKIVSNGTNAWISARSEHVYSEQVAPKTLGDMQDLMPMGFAGPIDFFFALMAPDQHKAMFGKMSEVTFGGTKTIGDVSYDIISMKPGRGDGMMPPDMLLDLAVLQGKKAWLHSATMTMVDPSGQQPPMTLTLEMNDWKVLNAGEGNFAFKPAADDEKVDDVFEKLFASPGGGPDSAQFDAMKGKPAPGFSLKDLNGATVSLAGLKGKTVILDFFATWCGPCKQGMPVLMDIAKARAGDGVVLFAVDLDEPVEKIQSFLKKSGWSLNVLLAGDSKISKAYGVGGIPHTVVIGPDGIVQLIEVGFMGKEHTEKAINGAIDKAIGKKVAAVE